MYSNQSSSQLSYQIRSLSANIIHNVQSSHIGSVFSCADIIAVLFSEFLRFENNKFIDKFILSKGHACAGIYSALSSLGLIKKSELYTYGKNNSPLMAHASHKVNHIEFSTGSLGHGLPYSIGKSIALKEKGLDAHTYVLLSDGELDEGSNWEAFLFAGHHKLNNLTIIIDYNKMQSFGTTTSTLNLEPLYEKFNSFNLNTLVCNGHNHDNIRDTINSKSPNKTNLIICNTIKGFPIDFMRNKVEWHYKPPSENQLKEVQNQLINFYNEK